MQRTAATIILDSLAHIERVLDDTIPSRDQDRKDFYEKIKTLLTASWNNITKQKDSDNETKIEIFKLFLTALATECNLKNSTVHLHDATLNNLVAAFADIVTTATKELNIPIPPEFSQAIVTNNDNAEELLFGFEKREVEEIFKRTGLTLEQMNKFSETAEENRKEEDRIEREANNRYQTLSTVPEDLIKARALLKIIASAIQKLSRQYPFRGIEDTKEPDEQLANTQLTVLKNIETELLKFIRIKQKELTEATTQEISILKWFRGVQQPERSNGHTEDLKSIIRDIKAYNDELEQDLRVIPDSIVNEDENSKEVKISPRSRNLSYPTRHYYQKHSPAPDVQSTDTNQEQTYATFADLMTNVRGNLHNIFKNYYLTTVPKVFRGLFRFIIRTDQESANNEIINELKQYIIARVQETTKREVTTFDAALSIYTSSEFDQGIHLSNFTAKNKITAALKMLAYKGEETARQLLVNANILTTLTPVDLKVLDDGRLGSILKKYNLSTSFLNEEQKQLILQMNLDSLKQSLSQWVQETVNNNNATKMTLLEIKDLIESDEFVPGPTKKSLVLATLKVIALLGHQPLMDAFGPDIHLSSTDIKALRVPQIQSHFKKHKTNTDQIIEKQTQLIKAHAENWIAQELAEMLKIQVGEMTHKYTKEMPLFQVIDLLIQHTTPKDAVKKDKLLTQLKLMGIISGDQAVIDKLGPSIQLTASDRRNLETHQVRMLLKKYSITRDKLKQKQDAIVASHSENWLPMELHAYLMSQAKLINGEIHSPQDMAKVIINSKNSQLKTALKVYCVITKNFPDGFIPLLTSEEVERLQRSNLKMLLEKYHVTPSSLLYQQQELQRNHGTMWLMTELQEYAEFQMREKGSDLKLERIPSALPLISASEFRLFGHNKKEQITVALKILGIMGNEQMRDHFGPNLVLSPTDLKALTEPKIAIILKKYDITEAQLRQKQKVLIRENAHQWLKKALMMHIRLTISKACNEDLTFERALFLSQTNQLPSITVGSFNSEPIKLQEEMHTALGILSTLSDDYERIPPYLTDRDKIVLNHTELKSVLLASHATPIMLEQLENRKISKYAQTKDDVAFVNELQKLLLDALQTSKRPANEVIEELLMTGYSSANIETADPNISAMLKILGIMGNQEIIDHLGLNLEFTDAELKVLRENKELMLVFETHDIKLERLAMFKERRLKQYKISLEQERQKLKTLMATTTTKIINTSEMSLIEIRKKILTIRVKQWESEKQFLLNALKEFIKNKSGIDFADLLQAFDANQFRSLQIDDKLRTQLSAILKIIATLEPLQPLDPLQTNKKEDISDLLDHRIMLSENEWKSLESPELHTMIQRSDYLKVIQDLQEVKLEENDVKRWFKLALQDHITALMRQLTADPLYSFDDNPAQVLEHEKFKALKPNSNIKKQIFATLKILALMGNTAICDALGHNTILTTVDREQINTPTLKSILNQYHVSPTTLVEELEVNQNVLMKQHTKAWFEKELEELIRINSGEILGKPTISYDDAMHKVHNNQLTPKKFSFFSKQTNKDIINAALKILSKLDPQRYFGYSQYALTENEIKQIHGPKMKPILEKYGYDIDMFLPKPQQKSEQSNQLPV